MSNENEERALIKNLKILDGKLNIKLEWPNVLHVVENARQTVSLEQVEFSSK